MHEQYMQRCIQLAQSGLGFVAPNPLVGSAIVHNDTIIGEGYHKRFGEAHAEVNAINSVKDHNLLKDSTIYVTLEPCSHFGKTPPCADLIIQKKIPRVVIGNIDPFQKVNGKGIEKLRAAGVEVITGIEKEKCYEMNRRFFCFQTKKRPYVILKWAQTEQGFIAKEDRSTIKISSQLSHILSHKWRTEEQAILVGTGTVINDNPKLTSRLWKGKNPVRIVMDKNLKANKGSEIFSNQSKTLIFNGHKEEKSKNTEFVKVNANEDYIPAVLSKLYEENIQSVIVEGGLATLERFILSDFWDEARVFTCPTLIQKGVPAPSLSLTPISIEKIDVDLLRTYRNQH